MTPTRRTAALAAALLFTCLPCGAAVGKKPRMTWRDCDPALVGGTHPQLGDRLHCAIMRAPLDHLAPDGRFIDVGVVRIAAADPLRRKGAIFFNLGGPGANPAQAVVDLAKAWRIAPENDPVHAAKRLLGEQYDLIAVIPRGLQGGWTLACLTGLRPSYLPLSVDLSEANWQRATAEATAIARSCTAAPEARFVSTEQHVRDMDAVRASLGLEKLSFYGISYGGKVGAWYAATFPERVDRMLLDSTFYFPGDYETATTSSLEADLREFRDHVIAPVVAEPLRYGLGTDAAALENRVLALAPTARAAWASILGSPSTLLAVLTLGDWIGEGHTADRRALEARIAAYTFSTDASVDALAHAATPYLLDHYFPGPDRPEFQLSAEGDSVRTAVVCNDVYWRRSEPQILALAVKRKFDMPLSSGEEIFEQLVCRAWGGPAARQPDMAVVKAIPSLLIVQSENDIVTPLRAAKDIVRRFPNAELLVARGATLHGLYNLSNTPCVEMGATDYLLGIDLPPTPDRVHWCHFEAPVHG